MKISPTLITTVAIIVVAGIGITVKMRAAPAADQTQYKVVQATLGTVRKTVSATGTLQPWSTVDIKSKAGGRINQLLVDVGTDVKKGQVIAKIDRSDTLLSVQTAQAGIDSAQARALQSERTYQLQLQQSRIAIINAQAALDAAKASRASATAKLADAKSQAGAQPAQTQAAIAQSQANYNQAVKQRKLLDTTDLQDQASAKAAYDQATANQNNAKTDLARQTALVQKGYVAQQAVDSAQASYDVYAAQTTSVLEKLNTLKDEQQANREAADARVAQARAALDNARVGVVDIATKRNAVQQAQAALLQSNAQAEESAAALKQAQADLANNGIKQLDIVASKASVASNQATYVNAKNTLDQTKVTSPTEGVVLQKYVEQGTIITSGLSLSSTGTSIVQIGDVTRMFVNVAVDETDLASVDPGQAVEVSFDAYPGIPFQGKVSRIDPLAIVVQNVTTFNVRVEIDNSSPTFRLLKPGMNATCDFIVDEKDNVLNVPSQAVQADNQGGSYVEIAHGGKPAPADPANDIPLDPNTLIGVKVTRLPVETGLEGDEATEITKGLKASDKVISETITPAPPSPVTSNPFGGGRGGRGR